MHVQAITYRQVLFLGMMSMPITGHFLLVSPMIELSGRDAWLCVLLTLPMGLLYVTMLWRIHQLHQRVPFARILLRTFGNGIGHVAAGVFVFYGIFMLIITITCIYDFTILIYLQDDSKFTIVSSVYAVIGYAIYVGIECVARASEPLAMLLPFTGSSAGISSMTYKDYSRLLPLFEYGLAPVIRGMIMCAALFGEIIILFMFSFQQNRNSHRKLLYVLIFLILFVSLTFIGAISGCISIFGVQSSISKYYPTYDILKLVHFGFINRFDIYAIFSLITGGILRLALWHIAVGEIIRSMWKSVNPLWLHISIIVIVSIMAMYVIQDSLQFFMVWIKNYYPLTVWVSICIPVITWIVSEFRNMRKHRDTKSNT